jgi:hypothetical protein
MALTAGQALERLWEQTTEGGTLKQLQAAVQGAGHAWLAGSAHQLALQV